MPTGYASVYGPFYPFGYVVVTTPGTPVPITQNLTTAELAFTPTGKSEYAAAFNQIWFQAATTNTGNIYLVVPGGSKNATTSIIWVLSPGAFIFIGNAARNLNTYSTDEIRLDADTGGNSCLVTGLVC